MSIGTGGSECRSRAPPRPGAFGQLFGRLLWGLAFQRKPGTLVLIDREHLVPTPFEADQPDPIALIPDELTTLDDAPRPQAASAHWVRPARG